MVVCFSYFTGNLHDFRYEGGAPINSGSQIPVVKEKRQCGIDLCVLWGVRDCVCLFSAAVSTGTG